MKLGALKTIVLFALAPAACVAQAPSPKPLTPLEQTLVTAEKSYIAAAKKGDAKYFKSTLTDDYSMVGIDGQLHDRQEVVGEFGPGGVDLTAYNIKVVELGDSAAIVTYDLIMQIPAEEDQGPPPRYQHWSTIWVKQGNQWKIKFQQTTATRWGDW